MKKDDSIPEWLKYHLGSKYEENRAPYNKHGYGLGAALRHKHHHNRPNDLNVPNILGVAVTEEVTLTVKLYNANRKDDETISLKPGFKYEVMYTNQNGVNILSGIYKGFNKTSNSYRRAFENSDNNAFDYYLNIDCSKDGESALYSIPLNSVREIINLTEEESNNYDEQFLYELNKYISSIDSCPDSEIKEVDIVCNNKFLDKIGIGNVESDSRFTKQSIIINDRKYNLLCVSSSFEEVFKNDDSIILIPHIEEPITQPEEPDDTDNNIETPGDGNEDNKENENSTEPEDSNNNEGTKSNEDDVNKSENSDNSEDSNDNNENNNSNNTDESEDSTGESTNKAENSVDSDIKEDN